MQHKIVTLDELMNLPTVKHPLVFTNGCFDILHRGHVSYIHAAKQLGNTLIVAVNSDESVLLQHKSHPLINTLEDRMAILSHLQDVDYVISFAEKTPIKLIQMIKPDVLVKGGDWKINDIVGSHEVVAYGGQVCTIPVEFLRSTTDLIARIKSCAV
jgi:rfaE bifunctional protein nucleotidyltransferase chain/domain